MAWKEYDVAVYHAGWYSWWAQVFQGAILMLGVVIIVFTILYTQRCDSEDDASNENGDANLETMTGNDNCLEISMGESLISGIIFSLSLAMSFVVSLDAYLIPSSRALHLKSGAAELESIIWLYRAPAQE